MQIPILNGIYADGSPDFRTSYPRNLVPVPKQNGISQGYLRPGDGIVELGTGPGTDRGGINWNGTLYRVMGTKLVSISQDNIVTTKGDVGGGGRVTFDYGFDYLAIASGGRLYLYDGSTLTRVTDPDLGTVLDVVWVDGYYMTTDGEFLVITELDDPFAVNPLKYGSAEADPDPIEALVKLRNEVYALNRNTIEVFDNVGATGFPFQRVPGAQIQKGCVGTHACCQFMDAIAFVGGGRNEAPSVWLGVNGTVWFSLASTLVGDGIWNAQSMVWAYDRWNVGHPSTSQFGFLDHNNVNTHWGDTIGWDFGTTIVYNQNAGAIFHELELISLTGATTFGVDPTIWTQYSLDGQTWSVEKPIRAGGSGARDKRLVWLQQGWMRTRRMQRFRGTSDAPIAIAALEARIEALAR